MHLVDEERARLEREMHARRFLLVNSTTVYLDTFVVANVRLQQDGHPLPGEACHREARSDLGRRSPSRCALGRSTPGPDRSLSGFAAVGAQASDDLEDVDGFGPGWWLPDPSGIWTQGPRAVLTLALDSVPVWTRPVLELTFDRVGVRRGRPVGIGLVVDRTRIETRNLTGGTHPTRWRVALPRDALERRVFDIALEFDGDVEWADKNRLGLHLRSVGVRTGLVPTALREPLDDAAEVLARVARRGRYALDPSRRLGAAIRLSRRDATGP